MLNLKIQSQEKILTEYSMEILPNHQATVFHLKSLSLCLLQLILQIIFQIF